MLNYNKNQKRQSRRNGRSSGGASRQSGTVMPSVEFYETTLSTRADRASTKPATQSLEDESKGNHAHGLAVTPVDSQTPDDPFGFVSPVPECGDTEEGFNPGPLDVNDDMVRHTVRHFAECFGPGVFGGTPARLHQLYETENHLYFEGKLPRDPLFVIGETRGLGWYCPRSQIGGSHEIGFSDRIFRAGNKYLRITDETAQGHAKFVDDILRHEMIHMYNNLVLKKSEPAFHGHGPVFAEECNRVGEILDLPPVRSCRDRSKKNKDLPSCSQWPSCVRPDGYYEGAQIERRARTKNDNEAYNPANRALEYLLNVAERTNPTTVGLELLGQAAVIALRIWKEGEKILPKHSTEIPFSDTVVI